MEGGDGMKSITQLKYNNVLIKSDATTGHPGQFEASNDTSSDGIDNSSYANT